MTIYRSPTSVQARSGEELAGGEQRTDVDKKSGSTIETAGLRDQFLVGWSTIVYSQSLIKNYRLQCAVVSSALLRRISGTKIRKKCPTRLL